MVIFTEKIYVSGPLRNIRFPIEGNLMFGALGDRAFHTVLLGFRGDELLAVLDVKLAGGWGGEAAP